jgi:hypothetical protein
LTKIKEDVFEKLGYPKTDAKSAWTIMKTYLNHITDAQWHHSIITV